MGEALGEQYALYPGSAGAKSMSSKALGVVLRKSSKKGTRSPASALGVRNVSSCFEHRPSLLLFSDLSIAFVF